MTGETLTVLCESKTAIELYLESLEHILGLLNDLKNFYKGLCEDVVGCLPFKAENRSSVRTFNLEADNLIQSATALINYWRMFHSAIGVAQERVCISLLP